MDWAWNSAMNFRGYIRLNKAQNWNDFKKALRYFTVPGQNFVYADNDGNIGYVCAAKLPIRSNTKSDFYL